LLERADGERGNSACCSIGSARSVDSCSSGPS
jgi:hypothetical protein